MADSRAIELGQQTESLPKMMNMMKKRLERAAWMATKGEEMNERRLAHS